MGFLKLLKLNKLIDINHEKGHIFIKNKEIMILPADVTWELFKSLERIVGQGGASSSLYIAGKELGKSFFEIFIKINGGDVVDSEDKFKAALEDFIPFIGSGRIQIFELDFEGAHILFRGWNLPEVGYKRESDVPVCHIVRGIYTEFLELITKRPCTGKEVKCQAKGDQYCEIIIDQTES